MEILGHISFKKIFYTNVRTDQNWFDELPPDNWIAFTIANNEDQELVTHVVNICINKHVTCICCAGGIASKTEDIFSENIVAQNNEKEQAGKLSDEDTSPMLTFHTNFSEGLWFATSIANPSIAEQNADIDNVVCIDMTKNSVKKYIRDLIGKFNSGELPSDDEFEEPVYDAEMNPDYSE